MGHDTMILDFWMSSFNPAFSLSSFTFIKRLFSSSLLSAIKDGIICISKVVQIGFPRSSDGKESSCNAGDPGSIHGSGISTGEGIGYLLQYSWAFLVAHLVKNPPTIRETWLLPLDWEEPLNNGTDTHSHILAWIIPWTIQGYKESHTTEWFSLCNVIHIKWPNIWRGVCVYIHTQYWYGVLGNSLTFQCLGLCSFTARGPGTIPGQRTKIPQKAQWGQNK